MGCYGCGGEGGSDVVLCPACIKRKREERGQHKISSSSNTKYSGSAGGFGELKSKNPMAFWAGCGLIGLGVLWYVLFSSWGPGFGLATPDRVYQRCLAKMNAEVDKMKAPNSNDPMAAGMHQMMQGMVGSMTSQLCEQMRQECIKDANGAICRGAMNSL